MYLINPKKTYSQCNGEFTVAHDGSSCLNFVSLSHDFGSKLARCLKNQRERLMPHIEKHGDASKESLRLEFDERFRYDSFSFYKGIEG